MGKLGKKARKFAKKNLQSVHKRNRKMNSMFKKKASKKDKKDVNEDQTEDATELSNVRKTKVDQIENASLYSVFNEDDSGMVGDDSDSDGYLSEDSSLNVAQSDSDNYLEDNYGGIGLSVQNKEIYMELAKKTKRLNRLKEKDPGFSKFLESYDKKLGQFGNKIYADEDEMGNDRMQSVNGDNVNNKESKFLSISAVNSWCQLLAEQQSVSALTNLLNGYRTACHYGVELSGVHSADACHRIQDSETFCKILIFMLNEADHLFRGLLGISSSNSRKEKVVEAKNSSKWNTFKPLIKSYLRSTLFLLNQATDVEILTFSLTRIRVSMTFFVAFPSLLCRLIKIAVHLWATDGDTLSSHAFLIVRDLASGYSSNWFDTCFIKTYKSLVRHCQIVEPAQLKHIEYLRNTFVELCSVDVQKSSSKAMVSIHQLGKILHQGLQTRKEEAVKNICSWQYISCIDIWVMFVSANIRDYDLQPLLFMIIQIINGVAVLFPGPRYLPLRIKCIQWLNQLSSSSGVFIPVASLVLDVLEHKIGKEGEKSEKAFSLSTSIKLPKHWLKSRNFQELCVFSAIELLSTHYAQWSHHISFPDLAIIPLICLRKFHEMTTIESFKRPVKRFIDQVEQNVQFVQKKRDEMPFSPKDQQSVESFLQLEKFSGNTPFTQYYKSIMDKAAARNIALNKKFPGAEYIANKREKVEADMADAKSDGGRGK